MKSETFGFLVGSDYDGLNRDFKVAREFGKLFKEPIRIFALVNSQYGYLHFDPPGPRINLPVDWNVKEIIMKIGELAHLAGISDKAIRYYEEIGILPRAERGSNGYRCYGVDALQRLEFVRRAKSAGLSLNEIGQILELRSNGRAPCVHVQGLLRHHIGQVERQLTLLSEARADLLELATYADSIDPDSCPEDTICSIFDYK